MSETKKKSLGKKLGFVAAILAGLLMAVYFVATSSAFVKSVILPKVSAAIGAEITVANLSLRPFSSITLQKLKVQPPQADPILEAAEVVARYSLMDIIQGNINISEVTVVSPVIKLVEDENGNSNLDALSKNEKSSSPPSQNEKPPLLDIKNVSLKNATILKIKKHKDGAEERLELSSVNLTLDQLKNGAAGKMNLAAAGKMTAPGNSLAATLSGQFDYAFTPNLLPENVKGALQLAVPSATGAFVDLAKLNANLHCDVSPTEVKNLALQFSQAGQSLGEIRASGPFAASQREGKLKLEIAAIDRKLLNLFVAAQGLDFGSTKISSTNQIELAKGGKDIAIHGGVLADAFSLTRTNQTTPALDLSVKYHFTFDQSANQALIKTFTVDGIQNRRLLLYGALAQPMKLDFNAASGSVEESAFDLAITELNLADWKAFAADLNPSGQVGLKLKILSQAAGQKITFDLTTDLTDFGAKLGTNRMEKVAFHLGAVGQITALDQIHLEKFTADVAQAGQSAATISGSGQYALKTGDADFKTALEAKLPKVFSLFASPDLAATSGSLRFDGELKQKGTEQIISGFTKLSDFTGHSGDYRFDNFRSVLDVDLKKLGDVLNLRRFNAQFHSAENPGGIVEASGEYDVKNDKGRFAAQLTNWNQHLLRPFLEASLDGKKLVTVLLNGSASVTLNASNDVAFKTDIALTNLVVQDASKKEANAPLSTHLLVDGAWAKQALDLRQLQISLSPTARAKNEIQLKGQLDLSQADARQGKLTLTSDGLDVTEFYDLLSSKNEKSSLPKEKEAAPSSNDEPEPVRLPVKELGLDVAMTKFFLREIAITNLQATAKITSNRMVLNPLQLTLNGAPVKAGVDLNLGVKGYAYDVSLTADKIPLEPLANSFVLPDKRGQYKGDILAEVLIKGAGVTGSNLQKSLTGQIGLTYTNALIQVAPAGILGGVLKTIAFALRVDDVLKSPLNWIDCRVQLGDGKIDLQKAEVVSEAFHASVLGEIPIAEVLTNSPLPKLPLTFALRRSIADKAGLLPFNTPTNAVYVALPNFIKLTGTLGKPDADINEVMLTAILAKSVTGIVTGPAGDVLKGAGNVLQGIGGIFTGKKATNSAPVTATNQPATNVVAPAGGLLDLFKKK